MSGSMSLFAEDGPGSLGNKSVDGSEIRNNHLACFLDPVNHEIFTISTGAGCVPSTVVCRKDKV